MTENDATQTAPGVSILMVMKNGLKYMEPIWPVLSQQDYDGPVEYIYIDSGSTDGLIEFMRAQGVEPHCIPPEEFHHGRTRNLAASRAQYPFLAVLSQDAMPTDDQWLKNMVAPFTDPKVGAVYGRQIPPPEIGPLRARALNSEYPEESFVRDPETITELNPGLFRFSNANSAVRRDIWERFRWDEKLWLAEDQGLCRDIFMAGYKIVYAADAATIHGHERNLWGDFQWAFDNGVSLTRIGILGNPEIGGETGYGLRRLKDDFGYWVRERRFGLAALSVINAGTKWLAIQLGKREKHLPRWLAHRCSNLYQQLGREP